MEYVQECYGTISGNSYTLRFYKTCNFDIKLKFSVIF